MTSTGRPRGLGSDSPTGSGRARRSLQAQSHYDQLSLLDEGRLRAADHVQAYQRKITHAFRKRVKPKNF